MTFAQAGHNAKIAGIILLSVIAAIIGLRVINVAVIIFYAFTFFIIKALVFLAIVLVALAFLKNKFKI